MNDSTKEFRRPEPTAEPQEPSPGGPNAVPGVGGDGPYSRVPRDMDPQFNPETNEVPEETTEGEDTETEATKGGDEKPAESEPSA
jgi:hypothetical protein